MSESPPASHVYCGNWPSNVQASLFSLMVIFFTANEFLPSDDTFDLTPHRPTGDLDMKEPWVCHGGIGALSSEWIPSCMPLLLSHRPSEGQVSKCCHFHEPGKSPIGAGGCH